MEVYSTDDTYPLILLLGSTRLPSCLRGSYGGPFAGLFVDTTTEALPQTFVVTTGGRDSGLKDLDSDFRRTVKGLH